MCGTCGAGDLHIHIELLDHCHWESEKLRGKEGGVEGGREWREGVEGVEGVEGGSEGRREQREGVEGVEGGEGRS